MKLNKSAMRSVINCESSQVIGEQLCSYSSDRCVKFLKFFVARELGKYETFKSWKLSNSSWNFDLFIASY